jgi:phospholipase C
LQFLEQFTGVREENISAWRRQTFGDLTSAFRFEDGQAAQPALPDTTGVLQAAIYEAARLPKPVLPGSNQTAPSQEKGPRKRVPR